MRKNLIFLSLVFLLASTTSCFKKQITYDDKQEFLQCQLVLEKEHGDDFQAILALERGVSTWCRVPETNNPHRLELFKTLQEMGLAVKSEPNVDSYDYLVTWEDSEGEHHFSLINDGTELGTAVFTHFPVYAPKTETEPDD